MAFRKEIVIKEKENKTMLSKETRKSLELQIEERANEIETKKREVLYHEFLRYLYEQYCNESNATDTNEELKYYQLIYGEHIIVILDTGYQQDIKQLLHYKENQGKLPEKLEMLFNEWILINKL